MPVLGQRLCLHFGFFSKERFLMRNQREDSPRKGRHPGVCSRGRRGWGFGFPAQGSS